MNAEQAEGRVRLAAKMYEARDAVKRIVATNYPGEIARWKSVVRLAAKRLNCRTIEVVPRLEAAEKKSDGEELGPMRWLWLIAATVELIEGGE